MFAIVTISGKQYRVKKGDQIKVANLKKNVGDKIKFEKVLLIEDSNTLTVGEPNIDGATVSGTVLDNGRDRKIIIFKKWKYLTNINIIIYHISQYDFFNSQFLLLYCQE